MCYNNINLHTKKLLKEALKNISEIEHKEYRASLSREFQISHLKAKDTQLPFCFSNKAFPGCSKICMIVLYFMLKSHSDAVTLTVSKSRYLEN